MYMREAFKLAEENVSKQLGGPFGCIIVKDGIIIARGSNKVTSTNDPTWHAEVDAIWIACEVLQSFQINDCELYTSCEPCPMCVGAIYWARPKAIYFGANKNDAADAGFDDWFIYQELDKLIPERKLPFKQMLAEEGKKAFELWKVFDDKTAY